MTLPSDLSTHSSNILEEFSFKLIESSDSGMWKCYLWTNSEMKFSLTYDRGYYDCDIVPHKKPINSMSLIRLLKFLKNDKTFYNRELLNAKLWNTLTCNDYVQLFYKNYNLIKDFLIVFDQEKYNSYNKFEFDYNSI